MQKKNSVIDLQCLPTQRFQWNTVYQWWKQPELLMLTSGRGIILLPKPQHDDLSDMPGKVLFAVAR